MDHGQARGGELGGQAVPGELGADLGAHLLVLGEGHRQVQRADVNPLVADGAQAHLDPGVLRVPSGHVGEPTRVEVGVEFVIDDRQDVAVECGRDAGAVVVGGHQPVWILDQVAAQQQHVVTFQVGAHAGEECVPARGREIADRSAEKRDQAAVGVGQQVEVTLEIADDRVHPHRRIFLPDRGRGVGEHGLVHIERDEPAQVAAALEGVEQQAGLGGGSGAEFDEGVRSRHHGDLVDVAGQNRPFGPGGVVLGQPGDGVEEHAPVGVVEPLGW